jgi:hypothetical protein
MTAQAPQHSKERANRRHEFLSKLKQVYGGTGAKRDVFGKREALPHEIELMLAAVHLKTATQNEDR